MPTKVNIVEKRPKTTEEIAENLSKGAGVLEAAGYATQLIPNPWTRLGGGAAAIIGGLGRTWGNVVAGNQSIPSGLAESVGDIGFPILGIIAPNLGYARSLKLAKAAENATKSEKAINATTNIAKRVGRYGLGVTTAGAVNYGIPAMLNEGTLDPTMGFEYIADDFSHITDPRTWGRLGTTFLLPATLPYMARSGNFGKAAQQVEQQSGRQFNMYPRQRPALPNKNTTGAGAVAVAAASTQKKSKTNQKAKTETGTYTGKPTSLTRGLIFGRKYGGKLENLKSLRK